LGVLEFNDIRKRFGQRDALRGIDLEIHSGEFFGLLGPNGAGKTTLMKILSGFLTADGGEVRFKGKVVRSGDREARRNLGLVPQETALYETLSPTENLKVFGGLHGLRGPVLRRRSEELLEAVGLRERAKEPVKTFSGGMKRRLNIVAALLHKPEVLLCDEPTVGVDPQSRHAIFSFLTSLHAKGLTILYTTHYIEEAEHLCSRVGIIDHGRLRACGSQAELLRELDRGTEVQIDVASIPRRVFEKLRKMGTLRSHGETQLLALGLGHPLSRLYALLEAEGVSCEVARLRRPSLEDVFLSMTGHALRD